MPWENELHGKVFYSRHQIDNGWTAMVSDHSQDCYPEKPTRYVVAVCCRWWIVQHVQTFDWLEEARSTALDFALRMPRCNEEATSGEHCDSCWDVPYDPNSPDDTPRQRLRISTGGNR